MRVNKKRTMTIALIVIGLVIVALGTTLFLTAPSSWPFPGRMGSYYWQEQGLTQGADRDATTAPDLDGRAWGEFGTYGPGMFRGGYYGMHGGGHFAGGALIFLGFVVLGAFLIKRRHGRTFDLSAGGPPREEDALAILRREFAEGRINEEEYRKRLDVLQE